jgi:endonuclease/exonuclease/phosphatase family metal-dependent hydrolase
MAMQTQLTCLFWNVARKDLNPLVASLAAENAAQVVVLAENGADRGATLQELRRSVDRSFSEPRSEQTRVDVFGRHDRLNLREIYVSASGRLTLRILQFCDMEFLFAAAHLPSKNHWSREDQAAEVRELSHQIRAEEDRRGHARTIVVGDLNMNPFDDGMVQANGLHAMMTKATTETRSREVQSRDYPFFYNPMWGFFGDRTPGPPGTYYYRHSGHLSFEWNILDQVLLRPDVLPFFDDVEILTRIGETELSAANGRPDSQTASDHFPIVFRLVVPTT